MPWPKHLALRSRGKPDVADIVEIEQQIGVGLPASFRDFITETGGGYVDDLLAECLVPTPFGKANLVELGDP